MELLELTKINLAGLAASFVAGAVAIGLARNGADGLSGDIIGALGLGAAQVFTLGAASMLLGMHFLRHMERRWHWFERKAGQLADVAQAASIYGAAFLLGGVRRSSG